MANGKMVFLQSWYDAIMSDEYLETTDQEMAYILYAAMLYSFNGEKTNLGAVFGPEFKGLNRAMPNIYSQIDNIQEYGDKNGAKNQKYNNDKIRELAAQGLTQKEICIQLGYDVNKCRSLSSNKGYIEGRSEYISQKKSENGRTDKKLTISDSKLTKNEEEMTDSEVDSSYIF